MAQKAAHSQQRDRGEGRGAPVQATAQAQPAAQAFAQAGRDGWRAARTGRRGFGCRREVSLRLYERAASIALAKGIIIADTKFEFGLDADGTLTLMDEVLTPDSSRYWPAESYAEGGNPPSFDKQFLRDWLEQAQVDGQPWNKQPPAPRLPDEVIAQTAAKYREAMQRLLG